MMKLCLEGLRLPTTLLKLVVKSNRLFVCLCVCVFFFFNYLQVVLSMVVVHLHESDYVAADNCYKNSFEYVIVF